MATAEQIKSLIRSYASDDREHFFAIALQVAAHEAKQGHATLAHEIRELVDIERRQQSQALKVVPFPKSLSGLVLSEQPSIPRSALVMDAEMTPRVDRIIHEYFQRNKLKAHGLEHRRKVLLVGPPGTGKTLTSKVLAHELNLPLHTIQVDRLVTKFMGETSAKLRQIFELMAQEQAVYFFDEFDAIGGERTADNDVGEMRRVLNAFLQFIEQDRSDSIIVAATNNPNLLDHALFRRFDDVLHYHNPTEAERKQLMAGVLGTFIGARFGWKSLLAASEGLSHAEIDHACKDAIKTAILSDQDKISTSQLLNTLTNRREAYSSRS